jgi:predicted secreted protein
MKVFFACFISLLTALPLQAAELQYGLINLDAAAEIAVDNDELYVQLQVVEQGPQTAKLTQMVNTKTTLLLDAIKHFPAIEAKTTQYTTRPMYRDGKIYQWQVTQTVALKTQTFSQMSELIADIDSLAQIQSMQFRVSTHETERVKNQLIQQAIAQFKAKARLITESLGKTDYVLVNMNVDTPYANTPQPMLERSVMMAADMKSVPAAIQGGTNLVRVSVSGSIQTQPQ